MNVRESSIQTTMSTHTKNIGAEGANPAVARSRLELRAMIPGDVREALALWRATEGMGLSPEETETFLTAFIERNPGLSAVLRGPDGVLAGALLAGHDGRRGFLYHLAVATAWRGQGAGRDLVNYSLAGLHRAGIAKVTVMVYAENEAGRAFWRKMGWETRDDLVVMQTKPPR
jgi:ribosomal protein S18 acetylase RimI-like enzyme